MYRYALLRAYIYSLSSHANDDIQDSRGLIVSPPKSPMVARVVASRFKNFKHGVLASSLFQFVLFHGNPFWVHLCYFVSLSTAGFLLLKILPMRGHATSRPSDVDLLFMSVSANTVSSMDTVEMEEFSNLQLATLTLLMMVGGEVFVSLIGLHFSSAKARSQSKGAASPADGDGMDLAELGDSVPAVEGLRFRSMNCLFYVVLGYLVAGHVAGSLLILLYVRVVPAAGSVLKGKGLNATMFSIFTTASTFANCGFVPTNENMVVFRACSGLLLILTAQALVGNTMYASSLRAVIWGLKKVKNLPEYEYLLNNGAGELGYDHLVPAQLGVWLARTVAGLLAVQLVLFCTMEWTSAGLSGLNPYQKIVGALFESTNSRYAGETIVDLSAVAPAVLVLFVVMMYLPPYTCFLPGAEIYHERLVDKSEDQEKDCKKRKSMQLLQVGLIFSPLAYTAIFTIIICITERRQLSEDPLNFSVLNIVVEVVSAYGTVGFTTGYSCKRQLKADTQCRDASAGFVAKWSNKGKLVLVFVMLFGRLKRFSYRGGSSWMFI
ncbi:sodium transporter HKT1-like isoform X2 [Canna indica]|uniref:Sodium transporter HKT1-like isoform X2 n=1 Tax=Canna indica TaxID=4628 RepID=A0AAQ3JSC8_9LILI|nr:sodium transporter HKT1-like isoform X2 [Canna indica]